MGIWRSSGSWRLQAPKHVGRLIEKLADPTAPITGVVRDALNVVVDQLVALGREIDRMEAQMRRSCRSEENAARLLTIPGVGPITASAIIAGVPNIHGFRSGRDFAAWLGLVPKQNSTGGKERPYGGAVASQAFRKAGSEG